MLHYGQIDQAIDSATAPKTTKMSGTEATYHLTKEDVKKFQEQESKTHGGNIPADGVAAGLQVRA